MHMGFSIWGSSRAGEDKAGLEGLFLPIVAAPSAKVKFFSGNSVAFLEAERKMQSPSSSHGAVQCSVYRELLLLLSYSHHPQPRACAHDVCMWVHKWYGHSVEVGGQLCEVKSLFPL